MIERRLSKPLGLLGDPPDGCADWHGEVALSGGGDGLVQDRFEETAGLDLRSGEHVFQAVT